MQRAATAILVAAVTVVPVNIQQAKAYTSHGSATKQLELMLGAIRTDHVDQTSSEAERRFTRLVSTEEICTTLEIAAAAHALPVPFFVRLIWQESRFRVDAVSRAGARGIAQFMPGTAVWRGLANPFDPIQSLHKSADYLRELHEQFGNLGLAAAAYNGGSGRVQAWLNGRGGLPTETRQYVHIVTGTPADQWRGKDIRAVQTNRIPERVPCPELVAVAAAADDVAVPKSMRAAVAAVQPEAKGRSWRVMLAGGFSRDEARERSVMLKRKFRAVLNGRTPTVIRGRDSGGGKALMTRVRIAETDRGSAQKLCAKLRAGGTSCVVRES